MANEDLVTVINNENPPINLEITSYKNIVDVNFIQSIESVVSVHNTSENAHANLKNELETQIALKANTEDINTLLTAKADISNTYTKTETNTLLAEKINTTDATVTKQGNTFNGTNQLVKLNSSGQLPELDGSLLTGVGGSLRLDARGTITSGITLLANYVTTAHVNATLTVTLPTSLTSGVENFVVFDFTTSSSSQPTISTSGTLKWSDKNKGTAPAFYSTLSGVRNRLIFKTIDGGSIWEAEYSSYGGVETTFIQPALSSNGTLGGTSFAVAASSEYSGRPAYYGVDNSSSTFWTSNTSGSGMYYIWYNPVALKVSSIDIVNGSYANDSITAYTLYGSNDGSNYTSIANGTNSIVATYASWNIPISDSYRNFYKYYKLYISSTNGGNGVMTQANLNAVYIST